MTTAIPATTEPVVAVRDLRFSYGERQAVSDASFEVQAGEVLGLLGPNGAGKSTTIKMIIGQLLQESGSITILGQEMPAARDKIQARMGVCSEEKNLYPNMTAAENLRFFARLFGIKKLNVEELLDRVDLLDRKNDKVSDLSKGMRQRLMIARALVNSPEIIVLDEPTDGLDPVSAIAIRSLIRQQADAGAAVLLTTHDMHEADTLSDRVAFINDGRILVTDTPEALKLKHGTRAIRIRVNAPEGVQEQVVAMGDGGVDQAVLAALNDPDLLTVHSSEATLEDVFVAMAGRGLA